MFLYLTYCSFWLAKGNISMPLSFHEHMAKITHLSRVVNRVFHSAWYAMSSCFLVFRRKDLCEAKHDVVCVWNFAQNWTIWGGVNRTRQFGGKSSVWFTPPKSSSPIWSHGTLYLTSSVKGILGKISISESAFEERGRFFQFHHITFDYLLSTTI